MTDFSIYSDSELEPWINGTHCEIDSPRYKEGLRERERRDLKKKAEEERKEREKRNSQTERLISALVGLKETWFSKFIWLILGAIIVGVAINLITNALENLKL